MKLVGPAKNKSARLRVEHASQLRTSIIGVLFLLGTNLLEFASGSESEYIFKVSIIGDRHSEILSSVNINSGLGFFYSKFSGTDSVTRE